MDREVVGIRCATEADAFYAAIQPAGLDPEERRIQRLAYAGMIWTKQLYYFDIEQWLDGDPGGIKPPESRRWGRNRAFRLATSAICALAIFPIKFDRIEFSSPRNPIDPGGRMIASWLGK